MVTKYFIYGVSLPIKWKIDWEDAHGTKFREAFLEFRNAFWEEGKEVSNGIAYPYSGRDGDSFIIGIVLERNSEKEFVYKQEQPVLIPELTDEKKKIFEDALKYFFGIKEDFHYFYVLNKQ